jgi:large subunit ribosomal protein L9
MQVIFLQDVKDVARKGDTKQVKKGYFKNFLAPRKLATIATPGVLKHAEKMKHSIVIQKERLVEEAEEVKKKLEGLTITITKKARDEKLYGSISEQDIIEAVEKAAKVRFGKNNLKMDESIKTVGEHKVLINLANGVEVSITVDVKSE